MLGLGIMLTQVDDEGREFGIAKASHSNNNAKSKYSFYVQKMFVIVCVVIHFNC